MSRRVAVFAREPRIGHVKTRLAADIGEAKALDCYTKTLEIAIQAASNQALELWYEGNPASSWIERRLHLKEQPAGSLGNRMLSAFCDGVDIVIGSDIPLITNSYVDRAAELLTFVDVVLGPTEDGGYCLIGMRRALPELFEGVTWSSTQVLGATLRNAKRQNLRVELLAPLWDIDDATGYDRWISMQNENSAQCAQSA
ncbi:MAG: TIGR04282 family arsenosugar biosynthesis glycosyltransferase [Gammaproteobacteria bacterium]|nr:TIGR04282 family arsenosugar biosynthesis glycosyltransferase [Gammaproteobacteria bacterium]